MPNPARKRQRVYSVERLMEVADVPRHLVGPHAGDRNITEFAEWLGVDRTTLVRQLHGPGVRLSTAARYCETLGMHPDEVWSEYLELDETDERALAPWFEDREREAAAGVPVEYIPPTEAAA